jgi:hypothetical protein
MGDQQIVASRQRPDHVRLREYRQPVPVDLTCRWCGERLVAIGEWQWGFTMNGGPDVAFRHVGGGPTCTEVRVHPAEPYDSWTSGRTVREAQMAMWDAEDAALDNGPTR